MKIQRRNRKTKKFLLQALGRNISNLLMMLLFTFHGHAQPYFQKIYKLGDTTSLFANIYLKGDSTYLVATTGKAGSHFDTQLISIDAQGELLSQVRYDVFPNQFAAFSKTDVDTNFRGNLVLGFDSPEQAFPDGGQPRIVEMNFDGHVVNDYIIDDFKDSLFVFFSNGGLIHDYSDSSYILAFSYQDYTLEDPDLVGFQGVQGVLLMKIDHLGSMLWYKKYYISPTAIFSMGGFLRLSVQTLRLKIVETIQATDNRKIHFYDLDGNGSELDHRIFQDGQYPGHGLSFLPLADSSMIYAYYEGEFQGNDYKHRPVITRLDKDLNIKWKDTLRSFYGNWSPFSIPGRFKIISDTTILYAYKYFYDMGINEYQTTRIECRNQQSGKLQWYRDYNYYPVTFDNDPEQQISDLKQMQDGDWLFAGQVIHYDLINQNLSGQNAYLLKTNCLGFMGDPKAGVDIYDLGNNEVKLVNTSVQGGSFNWDFGDGTTFTTGDRSTSKQDTIYHTYPDQGAYVVRVIATGCKGKADTINVPWNWVKVDEMTKDRENLLQINPNPVQNNDLLSIYVGQISQGKHEIQIVNELGQVVGTYPVPHGDVNLGITATWGAGIYLVHLVQGDEVLVRKKIIVQ